MRFKALIALILFVPVFSVGVIASLFVAPGIVGNSIFTAMKVWGVAFPLAWTIVYSRKKLRLPKFEQREINAGLLLGIVMFGAILVAYFLCKDAIALTDIRAKAAEVGITSPVVYLAGCFYWSFINSLIEELTWRGFVVFNLKQLVSPKLAIILAALFFTVHHSIALYGYTHNWLVVGLGSLGVFIAGLVWSWCFSYYKSVVPGYIKSYYSRFGDRFGRLSITL